MHWFPHLLSSHSLLVLARSFLATICASAALYYAFAVYSARSFFRSRRKSMPHHVPITILKPIRGLDRGAYENFASFCRQEYPRYQVIFGASDEEEPAIAIARRIARDFPDVDVRIVVGGAPSAPNPKVGNLAGMLAAAKYPILLISDSDIRVGPSHLETIVQPMADPGVGVVTCLYRSEAVGFAGAMDALGLSTEFQPAVLVAGKLEGITFAMGSGILIRRSVLDEIGGFAAVADYLADDYLLGNLPGKAGYRVELSRYVVEHRLGTSTLRELAEHQIRWNRGIRAARPWGYAGLLFTHGVPASLLLLLLTGASAVGWLALGGTLACRIAMAWFVAVRCLEDRVARRALWLVPLRDLLSFGLWVGAFFGRTVVWRGSRFRLEKGGRLVGDEAAGSAERPTVVRPSVAS